MTYRPIVTGLILRVMVLIFLFSWTICAREEELIKGKALEGHLQAGAKASYSVQLTAGDYAQLSFETHGGEFIVIIYGPSGEKVRGFKCGPLDEKVDFVTEETGRHRLEIGAAKNSTYAVTFTKVMPLSERLEAGPAKYESSRIKKLRASIRTGQRGSVQDFWNQVKKEGTPLIEPLKGDDKNMLVTFVWRGMPNTHNVLLQWWPFTGQAPDVFHLEKIPQTDVWFKSLRIDATKRFIYSFAPNAPHLPIDQKLLTPELQMLLIAETVQDPFNPNRLAVAEDDPDAPNYQGVSAVEMPGAPSQPWLVRRPNVPAGSIESQRFKSGVLNNEREIGVYLPPGYSPKAERYDLLLLFDLQSYLPKVKGWTLIPTPTILDNLISEGRIPPTVAIFIGNVPGGRVRELTCNPTFEEFLTSELVPWVRRSYNVTTDPRKVAIGGASAGGLAATCAALNHSETFGNVLSQSGAYWWVPKPNMPGESDPDAEPDWVAKQVIGRPLLPIRFYLNPGNDELDLTGQGGDILVPNRNLRDVLLSKGYKVQYEEFDGGHDYLSWRSTLANGLIFLLGQ